MEVPTQPDTYSVSKIEKLEDGRWLFTASMNYGDNTVAIPMPFEVLWAGDTPVITLTDQLIPGLGTFSARVLVYKDEYAGTWKHEPSEVTCGDGSNGQAWRKRPGSLPRRTATRQTPGRDAGRYNLPCSTTISRSTSLTATTSLSPSGQVIVSSSTTVVSPIPKVTGSSICDR